MLERGGGQYKADAACACWSYALQRLHKEPTAPTPTDGDLRVSDFASEFRTVVFHEWMNVLPDLPMESVMNEEVARHMQLGAAAAVLERLAQDVGVVKRMLDEYEVPKDVIRYPTLSFSASDKGDAWVRMQIIMHQKQAAGVTPAPKAVDSNVCLHGGMVSIAAVDVEQDIMLKYVKAVCCGTPCRLVVYDTSGNVTKEV